MRQEDLLQRAADALGRLPVHALVTTGPAVDPAVIRAPENVSVRRWARHADVLPYCSAVVTHGGHGTVIKALTAAVPLVIAPLGRDQPDNAARVVHAEAGLRVRKNHRNRYLSSLVSDWMRGVGLIVVSGQGVSQVTHSYRAAGVVAARDGGAVSDRGRQRLRAW